MDFGLVMILLFLVLTLLGVSLWISLIFPPLLYILLFDIPILLVAQRMARSLNSFSLLAVPTFIYVGTLMNHSGISTRIFEFANDLLGHFNGGIAHVNIFGSLIFSGMSGSALADLGGIGRIMIDQMIDNDYSPEFSAALTSASATIGPIFPPSIPLIIFGVIAQVSIVSLLLAGILPALVAFVALLLGTAVIARIHEFPRRDRATRGEMVRSFMSAAPALAAPVVLIGGMLSGVFGATEAAAITILYIVGINIVFFRAFEIGHIWTAAKEAARTTSVIMIIIAGATLFSWVISAEGTTDTVASAIFSISSNPLVVLLLVNLMLLVIGLFLEPLSAMVMTIPVVVPPLVEFGIDPVHIGVIMVLNLMIGLLTPPLGLSLYMASDMADTKPERVIRQIVPYYGILLAALLIVTLVPELSLWIPGLR